MVRSYRMVGYDGPSQSESIPIRMGRHPPCSGVDGGSVLKKNTGPEGGWLVTCDGCGKEILAQVFEDRIVVMDKRHGGRHIAVIPRCELLRIMGSCVQAPDNPVPAKADAAG